MRRRAFMAMLGAAAAWPITARAQSIPVLGFLNSGSAESFAHLAAAFRAALAEAGYIEGENVVIEYRWAGGHYERLPALAAELVRRQVTVLAATGADPSLTAAMAATKTIPTIMLIGSDPVASGYVASLSRPGGNVTGVTLLATSLGPKRIELALELIPRAKVLAALINPDFPPADAQAKDAERAAAARGVSLIVLKASIEDDFAAAFSAFVQHRASALIVTADPFFNSRRDKIVSLASQDAIPVIYDQREFVLAGGLASYGTSLTDAYHRVGSYAARILKGARPADLPVEQAAKFELVINLKTAKALGLEVPPSVLAQADEVIE